MKTTSNMSLRSWSNKDKYSKSELVQNWAAIDQHDHTPGNGTQLTTASFVDHAITKPKLAPGVVPVFNPPNVVSFPNSPVVGSNQFAPQSVTPDKLQVKPIFRAGTFAYTGSYTYPNGNGFTTVTLTPIAEDTNSLAQSNSSVKINIPGVYVVIARLGLGYSGGSYSSGATSYVAIYKTAFQILASEGLYSQIGTPGYLFTLSTVARLQTNDVLYLGLTLNNMSTLHPYITGRAFELAFLGP